ncbi:hypothetical protein GQ55_6G108200 [Panicum hallii var. hallii]|uniref:Uncharacterized protein n=1 Tax=Panicum hallii var. hallii TaxID=1504633 RepID=A0A2T7D5M3_9POAL|nr:hypothetical protein GQ55_6G108200 [Panicum hallii var. hallii]
MKLWQNQPSRPASPISPRLAHSRAPPRLLAPRGPAPAPAEPPARAANRASSACTPACSTSMHRTSSCAHSGCRSLLLLRRGFACASSRSRLSRGHAPAPARPVLAPLAQPPPAHARLSRSALLAAPLLPRLRHRLGRALRPPACRPGARPSRPICACLKLSRGREREGTGWIRLEAGEG